MNRTLRSQLLIVIVVFAVLFVALAAAPGTFVIPAAGQSGVTRLPRPHPQSHVALTGAVARSPRPHPTSHRSFPPGIDPLNPRPHPRSHLDLPVPEK